MFADSSALVTLSDNPNNWSGASMIHSSESNCIFERRMDCIVQVVYCAVQIEKLLTQNVDIFLSLSVPALDNEAGAVFLVN